MSRVAAITVNRPRERVERLWQESGQPAEYARVTFTDAPGDRGTEIRIYLERSSPGGKLREVARKVAGSPARAKAMDELRRFKQRVETGVIACSDATPGGERAKRKLKQRPAQPLSEAELEKVGA